MRHILFIALVSFLFAACTAPKEVTALEDVVESPIRINVWRTSEVTVGFVDYPDGSTVPIRSKDNRYGGKDLHWVIN